MSNELIDLTNSLCDCEAKVDELDALDFYLGVELENLLKDTRVAPYITHMAQRMFLLSSISGEKIKELKEIIDKKVFPVVKQIEKEHENKT